MERFTARLGFVVPPMTSEQHKSRSVQMATILVRLLVIFFIHSKVESCLTFVICPILRPLCFHDPGRINANDRFYLSFVVLCEVNQSLQIRIFFLYFYEGYSRTVNGGVLLHLNNWVFDLGHNADIPGLVGN